MKTKNQIIMRDHDNYRTGNDQIPDEMDADGTLIVVGSLGTKRQYKESYGWKNVLISHHFSRITPSEAYELSEKFINIVFINPTYFLSNRQSKVTKNIRGMMTHYHFDNVVAVYDCMMSNKPGSIHTTLGAIFPNVINNNFHIYETDFIKVGVFQGRNRSEKLEFVKDNQANLDKMVGMVNEQS